MLPYMQLPSRLFYAKTTPGWQGLLIWTDPGLNPNRTVGGHWLQFVSLLHRDAGLHQASDRVLNALIETI